MVLVSGLSRSGKTTYAANANWFLRRNGFSSHILEMDSHLRPDRSENMVATDRYDQTALAATAAQILRGDSASYDDVGFSHETNKSISYGSTDIDARPILIVDGTFASLLGASSDCKVIIFMSSQTRS